MTGQRPLLLVVDDEPGTLDVVGRLARRAGFDVVPCASGQEALARMQPRGADLVLVDLRMPEVGGLDVLRAIHDADPHCEAVLMTGYVSIDNAVQAIKLGALDYLGKPLDVARLEPLLGGVLQETDRRRSLLAIEGDLARRLEFAGMIGRGPVMQDLFGMIRRLAPHVRTALVTGESGTGKELVARALHKAGPRRDRRFVTVSCSAAIETLFESEVSGHVRRAFPGGFDNEPGPFELADGGTLFLDEVGDLPPTVQARLLRVLELGEVPRVGALEPRRVDVQVIAASSRDLRAEVAAGRFRSDLYYRLSIVEVKVPALRERREDIPYLTAAFVRETSERLQKPLLALTRAAERMLTSAPWDGNVRELRNVIERVSILAHGAFITERELAISLPVHAPARPGPGLPAMTPFRPPASDDSDLLVNVERDHIQRALARSNGNKKAAAKMLGLSRRALYRRLERLDLSSTISRRRDGAALAEA